MLAFIEGAIADARGGDVCRLLELGAKMEESAHCFHDVMEILIEKLPRQDSIATKYVFWYMLRLLWATFDDYLKARISPDAVADANAQAALASYARVLAKGKSAN